MRNESWGRLLELPETVSLCALHKRVSACLQSLDQQPETSNFSALYAIKSGCQLCWLKSEQLERSKKQQLCLSMKKNLFSIHFADIC